MSRFPKSLSRKRLPSLAPTAGTPDRFSPKSETAPLLLPVPPSTLCRRKCRFRDHVATLKGVKGNSGWGFSPAPAGRETDLLGRVVPAYDIRSDGIGQFRLLSSIPIDSPVAPQVSPTYICPLLSLHRAFDKLKYPPNGAPIAAK